MRRTDTETDRGESLAGPSPSVAGPPSGQTVVPFRPLSAASSGSVADGNPPLPSAFHSLGTLTQAVVLRTANKRLRLKVAGPDREE